MASGSLDAGEVAELFGLGWPVGPIEPAATGWGGQNVVWRLRTSDGLWAVKEERRVRPPSAEGAFAIEQAAFEAGVPAPRPVLSQRGRCYEIVGGASVRCHEWMSGSAMTNEQAGPIEARRMGEIVAQLHALGLPADDDGADPSRPYARQHWLDLAALRVADAAWVAVLRDHVDDLVEIERSVRARQAAIARDPVVGSHRDLSAANVLFATGGDLALVDWDAAGPAWPRFERAYCPVLWAKNHRSGYDAETAVAFLNGYLDGGGVVERDDAEMLWDFLGGMIWWTSENFRLAGELRTPEQDRNALSLVNDVLGGPETIAKMQAVFRYCCERL